MATIRLIKWSNSSGRILLAGTDFLLPEKAFLMQ
jgi:hypothetical protein